MSTIKLYLDISKSGEESMTVSGVDKLSADDTDVWRTACKKLGIQHHPAGAPRDFCVKIVRASGEATLPELLVLKNLLETNDDFGGCIEASVVVLNREGRYLTDNTLSRINSIAEKRGYLSLRTARELVQTTLWGRGGELRTGSRGDYYKHLQRALIGPPVFYDPVDERLYCKGERVLRNGSKDGGMWESDRRKRILSHDTVEFDVSIGDQDDDYTTPEAAIAALGCAYGLQVSDVTNSEHESAAMALVAGSALNKIGAWVTTTPGTGTPALFMMSDEWHKDAVLPTGLKIGWTVGSEDSSFYIHKKEGQFESVEDVEHCLDAIQSAMRAYLVTSPETELESKEEKKDNNTMIKPVTETASTSNIVKAIVASAAKTAAITAVQQRMVDASVVGLTKLGVPQEALDIPSVRTALNILLPLVVAGLANAGALSALGVPELTSKKLGLVAAQAAATSGALALAPAVLSVLTDLTPFLNDVELPGGSVEQLEGDNEG